MRKSWNTAVLGLVLGAILAIGAQPAAAAPGQLDHAFGGGIVSVQPPLSKYDAWYPQQAVGGPNGRVYVLEESEACNPSGPPPKCTSKISVSRYLKSGSRDTSYGQAGSAVALSGPGVLPGVPAFAVDSQGRAVVAIQNGPSGLAIARLDENGATDFTFAEGGGRALACSTCTYDQIHVFLESKGGITVVAQQSEYKGAPSYEPGELQGTLFIRLRPSGALDPGYGDSGQVFVPQMKLTEAIGARANGAIVAGASKYLTKVSADGQAVDRDFAVALRLRDVRYYESIAALPGGDIVAMGRRSGKDFVARLRPNGAVVRSFGKKGLVQFDDRYIFDVSVDGRGRILLLGGITKAPFLMRLTPKGTIERGFKNGLSRIRSFDGFVDSFYSGPNPMVFSQGASTCRAYCQPHPLLFRFLGGNAKAKHKQPHKHRR